MFSQSIYKSSTISSILKPLQQITLLPSTFVTLPPFNQQLQNLFYQTKLNTLINENNAQSNFKLPISPLFVPYNYLDSLKFYENYITKKNRVVLNAEQNNLINNENKLNNATKKKQPKYINRTNILHNKTADVNSTHSLRSILYVNHTNPNSLFYSNKNYNTKNKPVETIYHSKLYKNHLNEYKKLNENKDINSRRDIHEQRKFFLTGMRINKTSLIKQKDEIQKKEKFHNKTLIFF